MTAKEYLHQAYRLDNRIHSDIEEIGRLREMSTSISSPQLGDKVQSSRPSDAPFVKSIAKIVELQEKIDSEVELLVALKDQIRTVIENVPDTNEQMVLRYRYIHNMTWESIGEELYADSRTVRRWHGSALMHVVLPEDAIKI